MTRDKAIEEVKNYENYPNGLSKECRDYIIKALEQVPSSSENPNKSEKPTSSYNKSETLVRLDVYNQVAKERDMAIQQLHDLGYELGITIPDIKYHSHHCVDRRLVEALVHKYLKEGTDDHIAFYEELLDLPLVTPQEPRKGEWLRMSDLSEQEDDRYKCSRCGNVIHHKNKMDLYTFNSWCGRCGSDNGRNINYEVEE